MFTYTLILGCWAIYLTTSSKITHTYTHTHTHTHSHTCGHTIHNKTNIAAATPLFNKEQQELCIV